MQNAWINKCLKMRQTFAAEQQKYKLMKSEGTEQQKNFVGHCCQ